MLFYDLLQKFGNHLAAARKNKQRPVFGKILRMLAQDTLNLPDDTVQTLQRRVMEQAEWVLLPQAA